MINHKVRSLTRITNDFTSTYQDKIDILMFINKYFQIINHTERRALAGYFILFIDENNLTKESEDLILALKRMYNGDKIYDSSYRLAYTSYKNKLAKLNFQLAEQETTTHKQNQTIKMMKLAKMFFNIFSSNDHKDKLYDFLKSTIENNNVILIDDQLAVSA